MKSYRAIIRHALNRARRLTASLCRTGRWPLTLGIAAALLVSALGPPSSARADVPPEPVARLQFVIKKIHVRDDNDWFGAGDLHLFADLCVHTELHPQCSDGGDVRIRDYGFKANSGDDVILERVVPRDGDEASGGASPEAGLPVYAGQHYEFFADIWDDHTFTNADDLGSIKAYVDEHGWGIGTFTARSLHGGDGGDVSPGDYDLTFEIRRAPLPDLRINGVRFIDAGDGQFYCVSVENIGERPSDPAPLAVRADGALVRATSLSPLEVNQITDHCVLRSELPVQQHQLSFSVDEPQQIFEMNESNNRYEMTIPARAPTAAGPGATASPQPKPGGTQGEPTKAQADLIVRAIRINGQAPDGKDDCKDGGNDVTVVVKNAGAGDASSFAMRLVVDGDNSDAAVAGLDAGQEREVRFDAVRLKTGERTLRAVADAEHTIDEAREDNNELKVTARCQG